jgi:hypothetical protein
LPIFHELPRNGVLHNFVKVHIKQFGPKLVELGEMLYGEASPLPVPKIQLQPLKLIFRWRDPSLHPTPQANPSRKGA